MRALRGLVYVPRLYHIRPPTLMGLVLRLNGSTATSVTASEAEQQYVQATELIQQAQQLAQQAAQDAAYSNTAAVAKLVKQKEGYFNEAAELLQKASSSGHLEARGRLGRWAMFGIGPFPVDGEFALRYLHDSAIGGDPDSMYWLARLLQTADELAAATKAGGSSGMSVARVLERGSAPSPSRPPQRADVAIGDESVANRLARMRKAALVTQEIKALRRKARKAKIARVLSKGKEPAVGARPRAGDSANSTEEASKSAPASSAPAKAPEALPKSSILGEAESDSHSEEAMLAELPPLATNVGMAERWLRRAAAAGHGDARVALGNMCLAQDPPLPAQAAAWYLSAVTGASIGGGAEAGAGTLAGDASSPSPSSSPLDAIDSESAARHPDALYNLGVLYYDGAAGGEEVPKDRPLAARYFRLAADAGDPSAYFWLGVALLSGEEDAGIARDPDEGLSLVRAAADSGRHAGAAHYLAQYYREQAQAGGGATSDGLVATAWRYLRLAEQGRHGPALFDLGDAYYKGLDGVERDYVLALSYYERAGVEGETGGLLSAGAMRLRGQGCVPDTGRAFALYRRAADLGSVQGWINMADMHEQGVGVEKSPAKAKQIREVVLPSLGVNLPPAGASAGGGDGGGADGRQ